MEQPQTIIQHLKPVAVSNLIFATNNENKAREINAVLGDLFSVSTLKQAGIDIDIPEPYDTLEQNAAEKATVINRLTGKDCFSEDTGLFTDVLNGEPGVFSARYAGEPVSNIANIEKLLTNLKGKTNRTAHFRTVIALLLNGQLHYFDGVCEGVIAETPSGDHGFGYDAIFLPAGSDKSFGEMTMEEKNKYSHRKKAVAKLVTFLTEKKSNDA